MDTSDGYQILLDVRPVRTPTGSILVIPGSKPLLAAAIALEWDLLTTTRQASKQHFIPLTSLVARAEHIGESEKNGDFQVRKEMVEVMMRYLDTDTALCWAPEDNTPGAGAQHSTSGLRTLQKQSASNLIGFLTSRLWPGIEIHHVGETGSIIPASQPQATKDVIRGWISELPAYELAGLERATLAGKGLLAAARLIAEWSPSFRHLRMNDSEDDGRFGAEQAAEAASLEVRWQTERWGEVEDTHDVEREDLTRQLGSVIVLVSGK